MFPALGPDESCPDCVRESGLCEKHHAGVLPLLARNIGWLKLMGNAEVEQVKAQATPESAAAKKARRRNVRKESRGYAGLLRAVRDAA